MNNPLDDLRKAENEYRAVANQAVDLWHLQSELTDTNPVAAQMAGDAAEIMDNLKTALYLRLQSAYRVVFHTQTLAQEAPQYAIGELLGNNRARIGTNNDAPARVTQ